MAARRSLNGWMIAGMMLAGGCGLPEHLALVREYRTPPALSEVSLGVQPFASVEAGLSSLARQAIQDALFAAQAGNRERTLVYLTGARAILANGPAPSGASITADSLAQMITDLESSAIGAQTIAERLQAALPGLGAGATIVSTQTGQPGTVCCWGSPTGLGDESKPGGS